MRLAIVAAVRIVSNLAAASFSSRASHSASEGRTVTVNVEYFSTPTDVRPSKAPVRRWVSEWLPLRDCIENSRAFCGQLDGPLVLLILIRKLVGPSPQSHIENHHY